MEQGETIKVGRDLIISQAKEEYIEKHTQNITNKGRDNLKLFSIDSFKRQQNAELIDRERLLQAPKLNLEQSPLFKHRKRKESETLNLQYQKKQEYQIKVLKDNEDHSYKSQLTKQGVKLCQQKKAFLTENYNKKLQENIYKNQQQENKLQAEESKLKPDNRYQAFSQE